ncbi:MAG TPA: ABC transporter permease [bacterium]|nr:ABC transporter permease [bacterium]
MAESARAVAAGWGAPRRTGGTLPGLWRSRTGMLGVVIVSTVVLGAALAPAVAPYNPTTAHFAAVLRSPTAAHPFGTDQLGRDVLSRVIFGARISLLVGVVTVLIAGVIGCALGLLSGYYGGWLDAAVTRFADVQLSFPFILLALTINAVIGAGLRNIMLSLVVAGWPLYVRVVRAEMLALRHRDYIQAAVATGARSGRVMWRHVLPNIATPIIVISTLQVSQFIIAEATISFLGFGIQPPTPAWGDMVSDGRNYIFVAWWLTAFPGAALALTALGVNLTGDWLRDVLDPRLRA